MLSLVLIRLTPPQNYKFIELICTNYNLIEAGDYLDLIFTYDDENKRNLGSLYLGKWNDGVV